LAVNSLVSTRLTVFDHYKERKCDENYNKRHNKFIFYTAINILVISNHNGFRVLYDKIASVRYI